MKKALLGPILFAVLVAVPAALPAGEPFLDADGDSIGNACDCDYDQNGRCSYSDFNTYLSCFGKPVPWPNSPDDPTCEESDQDGSGLVGFSDFGLFLAGFGDPPGPEHDVCDEGTPLLRSCDLCIDAVCSSDPSCCEAAWDLQCVGGAIQLCGADCGCLFVHDVCTEGVRLPAGGCDACVDSVCTLDDSCCVSGWDSSCVSAADHLCGPVCTSCGEVPHDKCTAGEPLSVGCVDACVDAVCAADPSCCGESWDAACVHQVATVCNCLSCEPMGNCAHSLCETGIPLTRHCDVGVADCVSTICGVDGYCCDVFWDSICVDEVSTICGLSCNC